MEVMILTKIKKVIKNKIKYFIMFTLLSFVIILISILKRDLFNLKIYPTTNLQNNYDSIIGSFNTIDSFNKGFVLMGGVNVNKGFIPDYKTAIKYAELLWLPIYGKKIYKNKPFNAYLIGDSIWVIFGTPLKNTIGGSYEAMIRKSDGKVIRIYQQK